MNHYPQSIKPPTLLQINSSVYGEQGNSSRLTKAFAEAWLLANPAGHVVRRDVSTSPIAHFDAQCARAWRGQDVQLNSWQRSAIELSDVLIAELKRADAVVFGVPMYNFGIPSQLKAYFDYIARAGVTFRYTSEGPMGLLPDIPIHIMATRGGLHYELDTDFQTPFLTTYLQFLGLREIRFVYAEGLNIESRREQSMTQAFARIRELVASTG